MWSLQSGTCSFAHWTWENWGWQEGCTALAPAQLQSARFAAAQIYSLYPELILRWILTLSTVWKGKYSSYWWDVTVRGDKRGCPGAAALFPVPSHEQLHSKASLQHLHFISHIPGQAVGSASLAEGTVKCCCSPAPTMQTGLYWDREAPAGCTTQSSNCAICFYWHTQVSKHCHQGLGSFR